jgi:hypothetical protein
MVEPLHQAGSLILDEMAAGWHHPVYRAPIQGQLHVIDAAGEVSV